DGYSRPLVCEQQSGSFADPRCPTRNHGTFAKQSHVRSTTARRLARLSTASSHFIVDNPYTRRVTRIAHNMQLQFLAPSRVNWHVLTTRQVEIYETLAAHWRYRDRHSVTDRHRPPFSD